jgi:hypothetical protein
MMIIRSGVLLLPFLSKQYAAPSISFISKVVLYGPLVVCEFR